MSLELAIRHAKKNPILPKGRSGISRFATVITDGRRTFVGYNSYRTHPLQKRYAEKAGNPEAVYIHSEISALAQAAKSGIIPNRAIVYIARVLRNGTPGNAKPCPGCMMALAEFGYTDIHWTGEAG